jgi:hypothetical protein
MVTKVTGTLTSASQQIKERQELRALLPYVPIQVPVTSPSPRQDWEQRRPSDASTETHRARRVHLLLGTALAHRSEPLGSELRDGDGGIDGSCVNTSGAWRWGDVAEKGPSVGR